MYIVSVCFGIVTISVLCTVIEIKTEVELICLAVCLGLSLEDLVLEQPIFKSAHNKKTTEGFFSRFPGGPCFAFTPPSLAQTALPETSAGVSWREKTKKQSPRLLNRCPRFSSFEGGASGHSYQRPRPFGAPLPPLSPLPPPPL